jgi:hypothetical protein
MKTLQHVATEMALHVLAYNMKRVIVILGLPGLLEAITAFLSWLAVTIRGRHPAQRHPTRAEPSDADRTAQNVVRADRRSHTASYTRWLPSAWQR